MLRGWPIWVVGLVLFALVTVILGGAFYLNAHLRPKVGIEPIATAAPSAARTATPSVAPSPLPTTSGVAPVAPADANAEKAAVIQAYLRYWDVYNNALLTLDTSHLSEVMAGDELSQAEQFVDQLRAQHHAIKSDVSHNYDVTSLSPRVATINDQFIDRSYVIDTSTREPIGTPDPPATETISCRLEHVNGRWKVVRVVKINVTVVHQ